MTVEISSAVLTAILDESSRSPDQEICGLLFGTKGRIIAALPCRNVAADPRSTFEIDPAALIGAHRAARGGGPAISGCYHSHPLGPPIPSLRDAAAVDDDESIWLIVGQQEARLWRAVRGGAVAGRFDPVILAII